MIKSIVQSSTIDYPNEVSTVLFVGTCNWRCEFCHNLSMLDNPSIDFDNNILPMLLRRKDFIDHIVISGGECTCDSRLSYYVKTLKDKGFTVGLHTNGSNPTLLEDLISDIDFIGMDIKTSFSRYNEITQCEVHIEDIKRSINLIIDSKINYDFRTTVYPKFVNEQNCVEIAKRLQSLGVKGYTIQQFEDKHIETDVKPYTKAKLENIVKECNKYIPTKLRGF